MAVCENCTKEKNDVTHKVDKTVLSKFCVEQEFLSGVSGEEDKIVNVYANLQWSFGRGGGTRRGC